jgi:hypothetical protein
VAADKLNIGNIIGSKKIISKSYISESCNVYDALKVQDTQSYITNGITSHNCAHIEHFWDFYASVLPTISAGKETKLIMATTPLGLNHFYKFWKDSEEGRNNFHRIFVPWHMVPGRDEAWAKDTLQSLSGDTARFDQEYNCVTGDALVKIMDKDNNIIEISMEDLYNLLKPKNILDNNIYK